jgi:hypothetical protein
LPPCESVRSGDCMGLDPWGQRKPAHKDLVPHVERSGYVAQPDRGHW